MIHTDRFNDLWDSIAPQNFGIYRFKATAKSFKVQSLLWGNPIIGSTSKLKS
jgi:hypothetical protein